MSKFDVPEGLVKLLQDFTVQILRNKPSNIAKFAADYFNKLVEEQSGNFDSEPFEACPLNQEFHEIKEVKHGPVVINMDKHSDDDSEFEHSMTNEVFQEAYKNRRKSVAADHYNPDSDKEYLERKLSVHEKSADQIQHLKDVCRNIMLFNDLEGKEIDDVVMAMFEKSVLEGETVIEEQDDGDNFYIIESGKFVALITDIEGNEKVVKEYDGSGYFGELALMYNAPRSATINAESDGLLWALSRDSFKKLVLGHRAQLRRDFINVLQSVKILSHLNPHQQMVLADSLKKRTVPPGECIIKEGDPGTEIYFVMTGTVVVKKGNAENEGVLTRIETGGYFGELALIRNTPRVASVYSETEVCLAVLGVESFERLLGPCIDLMRENAKEYSAAGEAEI